MKKPSGSSKTSQLSHPSPRQFLEIIQTAIDYEGQITHVETLPAREPRYGKLKARLHPRIRKWLQDENIQLWLHQTGALNRLMHPSRLNVIVTTPTASGKSLCYNIPVGSRLLSDPTATALYIFPRKALAQDQYREIQKLAEVWGLPPHTAGVYDGDASQDQKRMIRDNARVILTNPHGLNLYLAYWRSWRRFFRNLQFIVIDEAHVYRGVFGSNVALLLRRLQRLVNHVGGDPQFVLASATIANPEELAQHLTGRPFDVVGPEQDGSGTGERVFAIWIPPEDEETGERKSAHQESHKLFVAHLEAGFQTLMFTTSRKMAELQARWAKGALANVDASLTDKVWSYRAGLAPVDRRRIERGLKAGTIRGVVSTNALELGVDIGALDATILSGFPGGISSFWQQAGRAGRKGDPALSSFVPFVDALDMFYAQHPAVLFGTPHESAIISLDNPYILQNHITCAARERPIQPVNDKEYLGLQLEKVCQKLMIEGKMDFTRGRYTWTGPPTFPAGEISIEAISRESFQVFEQVGADLRFLMTEEKSRVFSELHEGAIYLYLTEPYRVESLDLEEKKVVIARTDAEVYTQVIRHTEVDVIEEDAHRLDGNIEIRFGTVNVTHHYTEYLLKTIYTDEILEKVPLDLPPDRFTTKALWFTLPKKLARDLNARKFDIGGVVHAVEHGMIAMIPLYVLCDRRDVGGVSIDEDPKLGLPVIYIYDGFPGGIGLVERAHNILRDLLEATLDMIRGCSCRKINGCPACIMSPKCGNQNEPLDKAGAIYALREILSDKAFL